MPTTQETHALCVQVMGDGWQLWIAFQQLRYHVSGRFPVPFCLFMPPFFFFSWRSGGGGVDNPR